MSAVAIIPARGGSVRIPRKNVKEFYYRPIIAYSIEKAQQTGLFDKIVVSTDDEQIALVARSEGATVHMRDPAYGRDEVGTQEVVRECLLGMPDLLRASTVCCIYATAPLMRVIDLVAGSVQLGRGNDMNYVFSVGYPPLQDAGQFYWGRTNAFLYRAPLVGPHTGLVHVPEGHVCDINTMDDWFEAEQLYRRIHHE